jgi:hypothetical protein
MTEFGKILVVVGVLLTGIGALLWSGVGRGWLGRLPGDIHYSTGRTGFYFPITTCILISVILSIILHFLRKP